MKRILIADASKASLVMTSEVFKDHFPGVQVVVARTSGEAIELVKTCGEVDAIVVDFDLPDKDGAQTAARIKKICSTPVLITGFDRPEVQETIEREVAHYDDCLSWLRKPVRAELVVEIVKRFCEGRYRTQRRVNCTLPVLIELSTKAKEYLAKINAGKKAVKAPAAAKGKAAKGKKAPPPKKEAALPANVPAKVWFPVLVEDASIGGIKMRLEKRHIDAVGYGKIIEHAASTLKHGDYLQIRLPSWTEIESGQAITKNWFEMGAKNAKQPPGKLAPTKKGALTKGKASAPQKQAATPLLRPLKTVGNTDGIGSALKGKVVWSKIENGDWVLGIQSENNVISKRLFDAILMQVEKAKEEARQAELAERNSDARKSEIKKQEPKKMEAKAQEPKLPEKKPTKPQAAAKPPAKNAAGARR